MTTQLNIPEQKCQRGNTHKRIFLLPATNLVGYYQPTRLVVRVIGK